MSPHDDFDTVADACIKAAELVMRDGSPALRTAMRVVLFILGREIADRIGAGSQDVPRRPGGDRRD